MAIAIAIGSQQHEVFPCQQINPLDGQVQSTLRTPADPSGPALHACLICSRIMDGGMPNAAFRLANLTRHVSSSRSQ